MTFEIDVKSRNLKVEDRLYDYVTSKTAKLDRYLNNIQSARVELTYAKTARSAEDRHIVQITLWGKGFMLRAEERTDDIFASFDAALDKIQRQIEKHKGKRLRGRGETAPKFEEMPEDLEDEEVDSLLIVRRKKFTLNPMDEREAIEQSQMLDHEDFFVFYNVNTNSVNVLYRRRDGSYGLIETEIG